jgi:hypothetical protein
LAYTTPTTRSTGDIIGATGWNTDIVDNIKWLAADAPKCRVVRTSVQVVGSGTQSSITWNSESYDNDTMHSTGASTERITFTTGGKYEIKGFAEFAAGAGGGIRYAAILSNGSPTWVDQTIMDATNITAVSIGLNVHYEGAFNATDYVELVVYQSSGSNLNILTTSWFAAHWIGT